MRKSFLTLLLCLAVGVSAAGTKNGFDLSNALIPEKEILSGGPPRDGIPAINDPKFEKAGDVTWLRDQDRVLGVTISGQAKAYPIRILDWHEIVNDKIEAQHFAVTYCPLCGTGVVFAANVGDTALQFGVSGLLYNSDVLLFDRNTGSLFSQIMGKGVTGRLKGIELPRLPVSHTSWQDWRQRYPDSLVLSRDTGFNRNYSRSAYTGYDRIRKLYFPVANKAPKNYHPKEQVLGVEINGAFKAFPFSELEKHGKSRFTETLAETDYEVLWNDAARSASAIDANGDEIATVTAFWFAWYAFHPDTLVFQAKE